MGRMRLLALGLLFGACSFDAGGLGPLRDGAVQDDGGAALDTAIDGPPGVTYPVEVELVAPGDGVVRSTPAGIDCTDRCSRAFPANEIVTLSATPAAARQFLGWAGDCTGSVPCMSLVGGPRKVSAKFAASGQHLWSRQLGGAGGNDVVTDVVVDARGDLLITGQVFGMADFGAGPTVDKGGTDAFVVKFSAAGDLLWARRFGEIGTDTAEAVALGPGGDAYVVGSVQYDVDFGAGVVPGDGLQDAYVARFAADSGRPMWVRRMSTSGVAVFYDVAALPAGAVFTGSYSGSGSFEGRPVGAQVGSDVVVGVVSAAGVITSLTPRNGSGTGDFGSAVAVDPAGNLVVVGGFNGTLELGGAPLSTMGSHDIFIARYRSSGEHDWSFRFGGANLDYANAVALDDTEPVMVGLYEGAVSLGGAALPVGGGADMFIAHYSSAGAHQWSKGFGGNGNEEELRAVTVGQGAVTATGRFSGRVDFGGGAVDSLGKTDVVVLSFTVVGSRLWARTFGVNGTDAGRAVAVLGDTYVLGGTKEGVVDFGGGGLPDLLRNGFLARLRP